MPGPAYRAVTRAFLLLFSASDERRAGRLFRGPTMSRTICFDFDGVLYSYTSGFLGVDVLPDPPVVGAQAMCAELARRGFDLVVLSTRGDSELGRRAIDEVADSARIR